MGCLQNDHVAEGQETFPSDQAFSKQTFRYCVHGAALILYLLGPLAGELDQRIIDFLWV